MPPGAATDAVLRRLLVGTVLVAWVVGLAGLVGPTLVAVALGCGIAALSWGWAGALGLPTPRGTVGALSIGGGVVLLSVALRDTTPWLSWLPAALAVAVLVAFGHQLLRRDGRPRVTESVSAVLLGLAVMACGVLLVPLARTDAGTGLTAAAVGAAALTAATDLVRRSERLRPWSTPLALGVGALAGALVAVGGAAPVTVLMLVGVGSAGVSHAVRALFVVLPTLVHARPQLVASLASVLAVGVVPYAVAVALLPRALLG